MAKAKRNISGPPDWWLKKVYADPNFRRELDDITKLSRKRPVDWLVVAKHRQHVCELFSISDADINRSRISQIIYLADPRDTSAELVFNPRTRKGAIRFNAFTTRAEILEQWKSFEYQQKELYKISETKRKGPKEPDLIYAIDRARLRGETFYQIYDQYIAGTLPGYLGEPTRFIYYKSLARHYNKFKPGKWGDA